MATLGSLIYDVETEATRNYVWNEHMEVLRRGIDSRTEIYKFIFIISQICALIFLTVCVLKRNGEL